MVPEFSATSYDFVEYIPARNYIGGEFVDSAELETQPVINPRFGRAMSSVSFSGAAEVDQAVQAAKAAYPAWKALPVRERAYVFYKLRQFMLRDLEELTWLVSHENGKTYGQAEAEVLKAIECIEFGCSLPNLAAGQQLDVSRGVNCKVTFEPVGVVAGVTPFNFPVMVPQWMLPQAIVGGNCFVLKPSEQVPLSMMRLAALFEEAGLPKGVFNVVHGGRDAVEALCDHPDIKALAFVGSTRVAKLVYARGAATGKRMLCLGGAKNHLIVVPDADLELTSTNVVASFTGCAGQRCMAAAVMVAVGDVNHIIDAMCTLAKGMQAGVHMGAITGAYFLADVELLGFTFETFADGNSSINGQRRQGLLHGLYRRTISSFLVALPHVTIGRQGGRLCHAHCFQSKISVHAAHNPSGVRFRWKG